LRRALLSLLLASATGCSSAATSLAVSSVPLVRGAFDAAQQTHSASVTCRQTADTCINHIIIVIQENRSFNNLFKDYPGAVTADSGLANCGPSGPSGTITLQPLGLESWEDPNHNWQPSLNAYDNGKMDGFCANPDTPGLPPYSYVPSDSFDEGKPLWDLAKNYVIADHLFPTQFGESFTAHLTLIAGNDEFVLGQDAVVDNPTSNPWGCGAPAGTTTPYIDSQRNYHYNGPFPCFSTFRTMADTLDAAGVSWKYYAPPVGSAGSSLWSVFSAIDNVYHGPDWANVISPETTILTDAKNCTASSCGIPNVAWVVPDWTNSDHGGSGSYSGPSWVVSITNTIHNNKYLWPSTAIVIVWDDWGGWYDNVPPPQSPSFGGHFRRGDFRGLGIRVPMLIVSPFTFRLGAKGRNVVHTRYEFGSILKFVEEVYHLPFLGPAADGYTDERANSIQNAFDFTLKPTDGVNIRAPYKASHFIDESSSYRAPDDD
jgi:phospholipase C